MLLITAKEKGFLLPILLLNLRLKIIVPTLKNIINFQRNSSVFYRSTKEKFVAYAFLQIK